jgi:hypothetical protein
LYHGTIPCKFFSSLLDSYHMLSSGRALDLDITTVLNIDHDESPWFALEVDNIPGRVAGLLAFGDAMAWMALALLHCWIG